MPLPLCATARRQRESNRTCFSTLHRAIYLQALPFVRRRLIKQREHLQANWNDCTFYHAELFPSTGLPLLSRKSSNPPIPFHLLSIHHSALCDITGTWRDRKSAQHGFSGASTSLPIRIKWWMLAVHFFVKARVCLALSTGRISTFNGLFREARFLLSRPAYFPI